MPDQNLVYSWTVEDTVEYVNREHDCHFQLPSDSGQLDHLMATLRESAEVIRADVVRDALRFAQRLERSMGPVMRGESSTDAELQALLLTCGHGRQTPVVSESVREPIFAVSLDRLGQGMGADEERMNALGCFVATRVKADGAAARILEIVAAHCWPSIHPLFAGFSVHVLAEGFLGEDDDHYQVGTTFTVSLSHPASMGRLRAALHGARLEPANVALSA